MDGLDGKVAVVTGGASGIGLALARRFATEGMKVVVADVETEALDVAAKDLAEQHGEDNVLAVHTDVRHPEELDALATATFDRFGTAHVVCNNAGVSGGGRSWLIPADRWRWIVDVNLLGVVNGIRSFVPRLIEQGEGHVVNTASVAGFITSPAMSPYLATKHAVVALTESLYFDLQLVGADVGVSVLCPEWVRTRIGEAERNRPDEVAVVDVEVTPEMEAARDMVASLIDNGIEPAEVADKVLEAIGSGRFWVFTHPTSLAAAKRRWTAVENDATPQLWFEPPGMTADDSGKSS